MALQNKSRLRNTLKKLNKIPSDRTEMTEAQAGAQEALDFLAMMAGVKPVMLLGRGYNDPIWIKGVLQVAADAKLAIWPPRPGTRLLARTTMAMAFQRITLRIRHSMSARPGLSSPWPAEIVFT